MKKIGFLLFIMVLGFGCMSSPPKKYHQIYLPENPEVSSIKINKTIYIDRVESKLFYDNFQIVYRESPYQMNYYAYDFWAERPGPLIRDSIYEYFKRNKIFPKILLDLTSNTPDLTFRARIRAIEEEDREDAWYARLSMEIKIIDFSTEEIVLSHEFDRLKKMPEKDIVHLPVVISQILEEELIAVVDALSKIRDCP